MTWDPRLTDRAFFDTPEYAALAQANRLTYAIADEAAFLQSGGTIQRTSDGTTAGTTAILTKHGRQWMVAAIPGGASYESVLSNALRRLIRL